jgi:hypothetical protein
MFDDVLPHYKSSVGCFWVLYVGLAFFTWQSTFVMFQIFLDRNGFSIWSVDYHPSQYLFIFNLILLIDHFAARSFDRSFFNVSVYSQLVLKMSGDMVGWVKLWFLFINYYCDLWFLVLGVKVHVDLVWLLCLISGCFALIWCVDVVRSKDGGTAGWVKLWSFLFIYFCNVWCSGFGCQVSCKSCLIMLIVRLPSSPLVSACGQEVAMFEKSWWVMLCFCSNISTLICVICFCLLQLM